MTGKRDDFDIVVIGGGPAGYIAAIKAARLGAHVALVEKDAVGGTCLNRGCIPTKYYLKSAELLYGIQTARERGISITDDSITLDMITAVKGKNRVVKRLTSGIRGLLDANGVVRFSGEGVLRKPGLVEINGSEQLHARAVILAGGSKAGSIPIAGIDSSRVLTSDEMLDIETVPKELVVIGGGVVGIEMGMIFHAFGASVSIIEMTPRILPFMDEEISETLTKAFVKRGISIKTGVSLDSIKELEDAVELVLSDGTSLHADTVLLSIGREADLSCVGMDAVSIERGKVVVNDYMETSVSGVFAVGDLNGKRMLAHAAYRMGETAAVNAAVYAGVIRRDTERVNLKCVPAIVYSIPEVGSVGLSEEAAELQYDIAVGRFPLSANGRALASGAPDGFVKVVADRRYGQILGVHIVGHDASEVINEASVLMEMEITVHELAHCIHGHPTVSEALKEAAADCLGCCMHLPPLR